MPFSSPQMPFLRQIERFIGRNRPELVRDPRVFPPLIFDVRVKVKSHTYKSSFMPGAHHATLAHTCVIWYFAALYTVP